MKQGDGSTMLFEVIREGKVLMCTDHEECIPPTEILQRMMEAGYTFKREGKTFKPHKRKTKQKVD